MLAVDAQVEPQNDSPLFVSLDSARAALKWPEVIAKLRDVYATPHPPAASPMRSVARVGPSWVRTLTAVPPGCRYMGAKLFGVGPSFRVNYVIILIEQETGLFRGLIDGHPITTYRTAGTSAVAVDRVMPREPFSMGLIGSGDEARSHLEAIAAIRPLSEVRIFSPSPANRQKLVDHCISTLGVPAISAVSAEAAIRGAELAVTAARSRDETPILFGDWLDACRMVVSIGSTMAEQREIDVSVVARCDEVICDVVEEVANDTGDMIAARAAGIPFEHKMMSLNDAVSGAVDARLAKARLPMFKSVGAGIQDVAVAELVFDTAVAAGGTTPLPIAFHVKQ